MMRNEKREFTISMRTHLINRSIDLVNSSSGMTKHYHSRLNDEAPFIMGSEVLFDCHSLMDMKGSFHEQEIAAAWRYRRENSIELALKMKLFESVLYQESIDDKNFYLSRYQTTQFGRFFRRMPSLVQTAFIAVFVAAIRISEFSTRFKWVTGIVSFIALAIKVWHSGLINNGWIAFSAVIGLFFGFLATLWR